ncbi:DeoR family transcriptional regulator [Paenibacillus hemerocallicola]|uniref:DeoR family transcriptional regulator n=1 Tax=Paenibacillus hemerocallicola TaxID=1172614 RepID=UPI001FEAD2AE|nr:DeoR family transcriptional regulator [Paenibacillus hemerocallicola]
MQQRHQTIIQKLNKEQSIKASELMDLFGVSFEMIRRDLEFASMLSPMPHYTVVLIGGVIRNAEHSIIGDLAEQFAERFHPDLFFMSMTT